MRYSLKVKTKSRESKVKIDGEVLKVFVKAIPERGKANKEVINVLKKYFKVPKSNIKIISGVKSKNKIVEIKK